MVLFERCLIACALYEEFWIKVNVTSLFASTPHPFPIDIDFTSSLQNKKKRERKTKQKKKKKQDILHSLRVTLIFDCICCIRGWPACHTRFDSSICQLRCISVSHYLTETYLIGSMKVLMGLKRNSKHDLVNGNSLVQGLKRNSSVCAVLFFFSLSFPFSSSLSPLFPPFVLLLFSLSSFSPSLCFCLSSLLSPLEVCKVFRRLQHRRSSACLQEGVHHPPPQEASCPSPVGSI